MTKAGKTLTTHITTPIVALGTTAVKASMDFESSFAYVRKTVNGTEEDFSKLADASKRMDTENERTTVTFYTGKENCFQLSSAALNAMGNPTYAQVLINPKTHQMLLMGTNEKRPN